MTETPKIRLTRTWPLLVLCIVGCRGESPESGPNADAKTRYTKNKAGVVVSASIERANDVAAMIVGLKNRETIEEVILMQCGRIRTTDVEALGKLPKLKTVEFVKCQLDSDVMSAVAKLPGLKQFTLAAVRQASESLSALKDARSLTHLTLRGSHPDDAAVEGLKSVTQLTHLTLERDSISVAKLSALSELKRLESLRLPKAELTDADLRALPPLPNLRELQFTPRRITDAGAVYFLKWPRLESLDLSHSAITAIGLSRVNDLKFLRRLHLVNCRQIINRAVSEIVQCRALEELRIDGTRIAHGALVGLAIRTTLRKLTLSSNQVKAPQLAILKRKLPRCEIIVLKPPPPPGGAP